MDIFFDFTPYGYANEYEWTEDFQGTLSDTRKRFVPTYSYWSIFSPKSNESIQKIRDDLQDEWQALLETTPKSYFNKAYQYTMAKLDRLIFSDTITLDNAKNWLGNVLKLIDTLQGLASKKLELMDRDKEH